MVNNEIKDLILSILGDYVTEDKIAFYGKKNFLIFIICIKDHNFKISYEFIDSFYTIRVENVRNNSINNIVFLTKSSGFKKDIKKIMKKQNLNRKLFANHISAFLTLIKMQLIDDSLVDIEKYTPDLKFDGIFL